MSFTNQSKNTSSYTNTSKNTSVFTNESKNTSTYTNTSKNTSTFTNTSSSSQTYYLLTDILDYILVGSAENEYLVLTEGNVYSNLAKS